MTERYVQDGVAFVVGLLRGTQDQGPVEMIRAESSRRPKVAALHVQEISATSRILDEWSPKLAKGSLGETFHMWVTPQVYSKDAAVQVVDRSVTLCEVGEVTGLTGQVGG